jgi:D-alanyl-D-alanine carboxypeptidase
VAVVLGVVMAALWLGGGGGSSGSEKACEGAGCVVPTVLGVAGKTTPVETVYPAQALTSPGAAPPAVAAAGAAIIEEPCGNALFAQNSHDQLPPASLAKMATALVVAEHASMTDIVTVQLDGGELSLNTDSTVMGIKPGQRLSVKDLLYGLLMRSGSDSALALAQYVGKTVPAFVGLMNQEAATLGLKDTRFTNPHGLDDVAQYSSAYDMALLGGELLTNPDLASMVRTKTYQPNWDGPVLTNINLMIGSYGGAIGVKTGFTDGAGGTIVAAARRGQRTLIVSLMRSPDIFGEASQLLDWAFSSVPSVCTDTARVPAALPTPTASR